MAAANTHDLLARIVAETRCKPGWHFALSNRSGSLELHIRIEELDNFDASRSIVVSHVHPVPTATYNERTWRRWIFEQCRRSMTHEIGESLRFGDLRPFRPMHGPGEDPYTAYEIRTEEDARTLQDGSIRPPRRATADPVDTSVPS